MSRRHWVFRSQRPKPSMTVPVAEILAWSDHVALMSLASQFGLTYPGIWPASSAAFSDYELATLDRIMREPPKPGRSGQ